MMSSVHHLWWPRLRLPDVHRSITSLSGVIQDCCASLQRYRIMASLFPAFPPSPKFSYRCSRFRIDQLRSVASCVGAHPLWCTLSRQGLNPINPTSAFNWLGQWASSLRNRAYCYTELTVSTLAVSVSTYYTYPRRDGRAELTWMAWLNTETVTHLSTNPARRWVTSLISPTLLPLNQTFTVTKLGYTVFIFNRSSSMVLKREPWQEPWKIRSLPLITSAWVVFSGFLILITLPTYSCLTPRRFLTSAAMTSNVNSALDNVLQV